MKHDFWGIALVAFFCIIVGTVSLPYGGVFRGVYFPPWCGALLILLGLIVGTLAICGILRGRKQAQTSTANDGALDKAKAELEKMYLKQHGRLPEYSEEIKKTFGSDKDERTKDA